MLFPDYDRSILSIPASLLAHYGAPSAYPTLPELDRQLSTQPRHVVFLALDGLGDTELQNALPDTAYLRRSIAARVTSVFPSTTTAAMTAYSSALSPMQHGWLGWMLYMKEFATDVITFMRSTYHTHKDVDGPDPAVYLMPYETLFEKLRKASPGIRLHSIYPFSSYSERGADFIWRAADFPQLCAHLRKICLDPAASFTFAYWPQPDSAMHDHGVGSPEALDQYRALNRQLEALRSALPDSLLIIASDHGLINATDRIDVSQNAALMRTLIMPPMLESRAAAFYVKPHLREDFAHIFRDNYADDFLLLSRDQVYASGIFGRGNPHPKFDDYIGDYIACATGTRVFTYSLPGQEARHMAAYHAGLTEAEMRVAVILDRTE